ncbi:MAG: M23 family metallopeptidase [Candidatus Magasanikbacteria bacterium]|nr:M23 family metallopeptidase [Candidatus Magasanikbacteria bacterium]
MKYRLLLGFLRGLILAKRGFWWIGRPAGRLAARGLIKGGRLTAYFSYRLVRLSQAMRLRAVRWRGLKRATLQGAAILILVMLGWSQTRLAKEPDLAQASQLSLAHRFWGGDEEFSTEEIIASTEWSGREEAPTPRSVGLPSGVGIGNARLAEEAGITVMGRGSALAPPLLMGRATRQARRLVTEYVVEPGDSLSGIAADFNISVSTILWENNLTLRSFIRPGEALRIPPASGVMHTVKRGEKVAQIAKRYGVAAEEIIAFNRLRPDGTDLKIGDRLMIPGGVAPETPALARVARTTPSLRRVAIPPGAASAPSSRGFIWPAGARLITQYFGWRHRGVDIAGPWQTAIYAAKAGTVEKSQCGWNNGYGCVIIIDHGDGVKTLYGHNSVLLVSVGEYVGAGQTVALMGNTGRVRGRTGIHVHFEVRINGTPVNPFRYVR